MRFVSVGECMIEMAQLASGDYRMGFAGDTVNTAWYVRALLDVSCQVDYVTGLGHDLHSTNIAEFLKKNGIGIDHIRTIRRRRPGLYLINQVNGDRHFTYWRDTSAARLLADNVHEVRAALANADMIYFSGITVAILSPAARNGLLDIISEQRGRGAVVVFDPNYRPTLWRSMSNARREITKAAAGADIVMPTFADDKALFGDEAPEASAARYLALGVRQVVVKNGGEPALLAGPDGKEMISPDLNVLSVDPTGAGDSFNGAYLAATLRGCDARSAVKQGHQLAARVIGHRGALLEMREAAAAVAHLNRVGTGASR